MKAEIIAIGTEILLGEIIDTNSAYFAQRLPRKPTARNPPFDMRHADDARAMRVVVESAR